MSGCFMGIGVGFGLVGYLLLVVFIVLCLVDVIYMLCVCGVDLLVVL